MYLQCIDSRDLGADQHSCIAFDTSREVLNTNLATGLAVQDKHWPVACQAIMLSCIQFSRLKSLYIRRSQYHQEAQIN